MKYSFFSSVCAWLPSALMMAVSASGASSAPLASFVKYVPEEVKKKKKPKQQQSFISEKPNGGQPGMAFRARGQEHM